ncbi:MAG: hypothetical protein AAFY02_18190 [Pseudomonadota bacterium]
MQMTHSGLSVSLDGATSAPISLEDANSLIAPVGMRIWPLPVAQLPESLDAQRRAETISADARQALLDAYLLPRARLLSLIEEARQRPHVPGGGALTSEVTTHGQTYPQLHCVEAGIDYGRFDHWHRNLAPDGSGTDEVWQVLWGSGFCVHQRLPDGRHLALTLACPRPDQGWLGTYDGARPHMGSVASASIGSKVLVQVIGPDRWEMLYEDG